MQILTNFFNQVRCSGSELLCAQSSICVTADLLCDGVRQCPQGDDELNCKRFLRDYTMFQDQTLLLQLITETMMGKNLEICAKRCLDLPECKGVIHDEGSRK